MAAGAQSPKANSLIRFTEGLNKKVTKNTKITKEQKNNLATGRACSWNISVEHDYR